ncbi:histidine kinase [Pseudomonas oryzihabitans]|nr:histidine kinase [Pseudomonas psychrotolerans]KTT63638.1 histidine kinase [Pseudomonas psychrotolerans]
MEIDALFDHLHTLPSIPKVAQELIQQFDDPDSTIEGVARNLSLDPVLSAKVLRLANSVRFRGVRPSTSIEGAAIRLGFDALRTLVLASAVTAAFRSNPAFDPRDFWQHSFDVASICRVIARQTGADAETAFTCGMLHSIGELLIKTAAPDIAARIDAEQRIPRLAEQQDAIGFGYPQVGAELARRWQLPLLIQHAIAYQLHPQDTPGDATMARLVAQARLVSFVLRRHGGINEQAKAALSNPLLNDVDLDSLFGELPEIIEADKAFGMLIN